MMLYTSQRKLIIRASVYKITTKTPKYLERIHGDNCGSINPDFGPCGYFMVLVDASARWSRVSRGGFSLYQYCQSMELYKKSVVQSYLGWKKLNRLKLKYVSRVAPDLFLPTTVSMHFSLIGLVLSFLLSFSLQFFSTHCHNSYH